MQIRVDLESDHNLEIGDDLTDANGITGIVIHVNADHVVIDTALADNSLVGSQNGTNECGQPATAQGAQDGAQNAKDAE